MTWDDESKTEICQGVLVLKCSNRRRRAGELTPPSTGRGGRHLADTGAPPATPAAASQGRAAAYPRGIVPGDLHSLEVGHALVGRRGGDVFIDVGHFGGRRCAFGNGQINSLPPEETLFPRFEIKKINKRIYLCHPWKLHCTELMFHYTISF